MQGTAEEEQAGQDRARRFRLGPPGSSEDREERHDQDDEDDGEPGDPSIAHREHVTDLPSRREVAGIRT